MSPTRAAIAAVLFACVVTVLLVAPGFLAVTPPKDRADTVQAVSPPEFMLPESYVALAARAAYVTCLWTGFPTPATAAQQTAACSAAIQSGTLTPSQVAFARLQRGAARIVLGDKVMASADYAEALGRYDSAIDPGNPEALALYRRGAGLDALGQGDLALNEYNEAIRADPGQAMAYFARGILMATRKRAYVRAIADFDRVLALQPGNVEALIRRGDAHRQLGEFGRALADLNNAIALAPDHSQAYVFRGLIHGSRGDAELALRDYNLALDRDPRDVDALVNRAAVHATRGEQERALHDLDAALAVDGNNPLALYNRGYVRFSLKQYDAAIADYSAAIDLEPAMGLAYNNRCLVRALAGRDLVRALSDCDTALSLMPTNLDVRETRGFIYLKLGDPMIAIREYDAALQVDPNRPLALYGRGLAKLWNGQTREGEADMAAANTLDPSVERQFSVYGF
ncbi:MAG: tetratricopeptide repeat protein [Reyranella sp.]|nr:tetratricopeptide repeat protein [Reyranella sp.]